ncbi:MAG: hypothetical protein AAF078_12465 [Planctomycetota bacterium]
MPKPSAAQPAKARPATLPPMKPVVMDISTTEMPDDQRLDALRRVQSQAENRVKLGMQLFNSAEARLTAQSDLARALRSEQADLRDHIDRRIEDINARVDQTHRTPDESPDAPRIADLESQVADLTAKLNEAVTSINTIRRDHAADVKALRHEVARVNKRAEALIDAALPSPAPADSEAAPAATPEPEPSPQPKAADPAPQPIAAEPPTPSQAPAATVPPPAPVAPPPAPEPVIATDPKPRESFFARFMRESLGTASTPASPKHQPPPVPAPLPPPPAPAIELPDTPTNEAEARIYSSILERLRHDQHTHIDDSHTQLANPDQLATPPTAPPT